MTLPAIITALKLMLTTPNGTFRYVVDADVVREAVRELEWAEKEGKK